MKRDLSFRIAAIADAKTIACIGAGTFLAAFGPDNTAEDMERYLAANFNLETIRSLIEDDSSTFLLCHEGERVIGYAMFRKGIPPDSVSGPNPIELVRFYILAEVIGMGYGSELMRACLDEARRSGHKTMWLGVWEKNVRAIRFYEKWGFQTAGSRQFVLGDDVQDDFVMLRAL